MLVSILATALLILATGYAAVASFREKSARETPSWVFPAGTRRWTRIAIGVATLLAAIGLTAWIARSRGSPPHSRVYALIVPNQPAVHFMIPEGYSGWVRVDFDVPGAPTLPSTAENTFVQIPTSGTLKTSSPDPTGSKSYEFYSSAGVRPIPQLGSGRLIWGKIHGESTTAGGKRQYEEFFVGTEEQFKSQVTPSNPQVPSK